jgi:cytochrome c553
MRLGFVAAATLAAAMLIAGPVRAEDAPDAAKLWSKNCQSCHGPDGKGKTKMGEKLKVRDLTAADVKASLTEAKAVESMKNGVKDPADPSKLVMKSFSDKLSDAEIQALAKHTVALK